MFSHLKRNPRLCVPVQTTHSLGDHPSVYGPTQSGGYLFADSRWDIYFPTVGGIPICRQSVGYLFSDSRWDIYFPTVGGIPICRQSVGYLFADSRWDTYLPTVGGIPICRQSVGYLFADDVVTMR
ncbi:hypothetical protein POVWA2_024450 [Plasmodium ovale wallikeri]|uniref:Uncharacterized protein n=1 Tax=Plasmodium ovale wallikeri TaxID=864142 RepID=A0A1A8YTN9_PLAOA|nr:hypothetical protein POVWA1_024570 [Plasmodium ovale wallikeri]SBT35302.1 hypothetical protein POVWA2_024450 [Plasmodium ovale wallikeri]